MKRKICVSVILILTLLVNLLPASAATVGGKSITSQGACVMDYDTGEILYEYNGYVRRVPASMTKIMNMYCVYEALENGEITLDTVVPISKNVYDKSRNSVYQSVLPLYYNQTYTVDELIGVVVTYSASGAAIALAELIGGTEAAFVERMNAKAIEMGLDAYYYDSCGIASNLISPVSMATLARNIIQDYPDILVRSSKKSVYFHGRTYNTTNKLLTSYYYEGANGLKTGTTAAAGYCFCGTAERNGRRIITVTMSSSSTNQRYIDTKALMDYGFATQPKTAFKGCVLPNWQMLTSESAFIMDYETGRGLYAHRADEYKPVASIAKMMSIYVIYDAIKNGEIAFDTVVPISENVYNLSRNENYKMSVSLDYDKTYTVEEMVDMIIIYSAAPCVTAVAELLCGSEAAFVERMNKKAISIGIYSVFFNGTGVCLNPETDHENLMTAREVAMMTRSMIQDYPEVLEKTKCASVVFHGKVYYNLNKLFTDFYYEGADGFKNGMTEASGYCMCGTAEVDGKRVITVTLPSNSNEARFTDTIKMFDYGFSALGVKVVKTAKKEEPEAVIDASRVKINIDGNYEMSFEDGIVVKNNKIMVPVRELMEILGKTVTWDNDMQAAFVTDGDTTVRLLINSDVLYSTTVNPLDGSVAEKWVTMKNETQLINGKTYVSVEELVEAFGIAAIWDAETHTMLIVAGVC